MVLVVVALALFFQPDKADEPFAIFVRVAARGEEDVVDKIREGRDELRGRLLKNEDWFHVVETAEAADIVVDLVAYWAREEIEIHTETRHSAAYGPHQIDVSVVTEHHSLRAIVTSFGSPREMTGEEVKKGRGSVRGAARDVAEQLEDFCRENFQSLNRRRR